ncbi:MAG: hypothetical protein GX337_02620 [Christensenellaceae bacterium]|nr:hypothetical protein [Christensenellaceae bacterium]
MQNEKDEYTIDNASSSALRKAQIAFDGAAEKMGVQNEDDVQSLIDEVRDIPNAETKKTLAEYEEMKNNKESYKRYNSFDEALDDSFDNY